MNWIGLSGQDEKQKRKKKKAKKSSGCLMTALVICVFMRMVSFFDAIGSLFEAVDATESDHFFISVPRVRALAWLGSSFSHARYKYYGVPRYRR